MPLEPDFILASASPRRKELLQQIGCRFQVCPTDMDETLLSGESAEEYVIRMALEKARAGWQNQLDKMEQQSKPLPVLGADTAVVVEDQIFGKPADREHAISMLMELSDSAHRVLSAVAVVDEGKEAMRLSETQVSFRALTREECDRYWQTGEPSDKAGAYAIQGLGAVFVEHIDGSYSGVVGLPLAETCELLSDFDLSWWLGVKN